MPHYLQRCVALAEFATLIGLLGHSPDFWMSKTMDKAGESTSIKSPNKPSAVPRCR